MRQSAAIRQLGKYANYLIALIMVLVPFHAIFTTWAGSNFGYIDIFRIWKELLMVPLGVVAAYIAYKDKRLLRDLQHSWLVRLILAFTLLYLLYGLWVMVTGRVSGLAVIYSLIINLRYLWFFLMVWIIGQADSLIAQEWQKILFAPAAVVVLFGLLQRFVLQPDVLRHVGYGPDTIPAVQTVDNKVEYRRIQSTLRGANPLGAYLMFIMTAVVARFRRHQWLILLFMASAVVLFYSYSRSAWIGLIVSLAVLGGLQLSSRKGRQAMVVSLILAIVLGGGMVWQFRHNDTLQNTLFHSDEKSTSAESSNEARTSALQSAAKDVLKQPFGQGPGSAGPASFRNTKASPRIAENYYLQIGQEVGIVGILLFLAILAFLIRALLLRRRYAQAQVLLATLAGILVINFLSHAWTDDTLSILWWGFAGATLSLPAILHKELKHEQKTKKHPINATKTA